MKITIMQWINIAIIVLIVNFNFTVGTSASPNGLFLGFLPILNGSYPDFVAQWYSNVGSTLCLTMVINIFSPHASKLSMPLMKLFFQQLDRGLCVLSIKKEKDPNDETDIDVNTKKLLQEDLNLLYTGDEIQSHFVYAQNYTYVWCVLMFSTGLPILYPFACIFFFVLYWVYKFLLVKYYKKTTRFNEEIPVESLSYF
jgi:hypothetical protein